MKQALYYKELKSNIVQCELCPKKCVIKEGETGNCKARKNIKGRLISLVYGKSIASNVDPIEKKPLYHFLPGSKAFSIGTAGCNLHCLHCQNYDTSQAIADESGNTLLPEEIVEFAENKNCKSISYTYNEPTIFYEYMLDTAKLAKKKNIKNTIVSNGFINEGPLRELCKYIDAANIDLKSFDNDFYKKVCDAWLEPVLNSLKILKENNVWLEITNLIIPTLNDDLREIKKMCKWIKENLGEEVPLHFSAFYPTYKLLDKPRTSGEILMKARETALKEGIKFVYVGNVQTEANNTYCPKCKKLLIERQGFFVTENNIKDNKCSKCGEEIAGVF